MAHKKPLFVKNDCNFELGNQSCTATGTNDCNLFKDAGQSTANTALQTTATIATLNVLKSINRVIREYVKRLKRLKRLYTHKSEICLIAQNKQIYIYIGENGGFDG